MIPIPALIEMLIPLLFIAFFLIFFLPGIFELKRAQDAGPRRIMNIGLSKFVANRAKLGLSIFFDLDDIEKGGFTERHFETINMPANNPIFILANIEF